MYDQKQPYIVTLREIPHSELPIIFVKEVCIILALLCAKSADIKPCHFLHRTDQTSTRAVVNQDL